MLFAYIITYLGALVKYKFEICTNNKSCFSDVPNSFSINFAVILIDDLEKWGEIGQNPVEKGTYMR